MKSLTIFPCGTDVVIIQPSLPGKITCIAIRFDTVAYEVTYYIDGVQQSVWCNQDEFIPGSKKRKVGFMCTS